MGAKRSQKGQRANETLRDVRLTKPFYLSVHEVTNAQYFKFKTTDFGEVGHLINTGDIS